MLSAHAQRLLFGLAWFVKECFLHGGLPSRRITRGHALYKDTFAKVAHKVEVFRTYACTPDYKVGWFQLIS